MPSLGDVGTVIRVTVVENGEPLDISDATLKEYRLRKPDASVVTKDPAFTTDGTDGKLEYTVVDGDLDQSGLWSLLVYLEFGTNHWYTKKLSFVVDPIY